VTPVALLAEVRAAGADLSVRGADVLLHRASRIAPELRARLAAVKPELLELLAEAGERERRSEQTEALNLAGWANVSVALGASDPEHALATLSALRPAGMLALTEARDQAEVAAAAWAAGAGTWEAFTAAALTWEALALDVARELARVCHDCGRETLAALADPLDGSRFCRRCVTPRLGGAR
jgi:hypothetical protein